MTHSKFICWFKFGRIDRVKPTAETDKYVFTDEFGRLAKSAGTYRVRSSMSDACNTMKHYYEEKIKVLKKELEEAETLYNHWQNTYML